MMDTQSYTESLMDIVRGVNDGVILLPEFQRDFRWDLDKSYELIDSLIHDIFIGTIIYGKPSFPMTLREIDKGPRKLRKGQRARAVTQMDLTEDDISRQTRTRHLRIVLDGQQRITSIYRALVGPDDVYVYFKGDLDPTALGHSSLEDIVDGVGGEDRDDRVSVLLRHAYDDEMRDLEEADRNARFAETRYGKTLAAEAVEASELAIAQKIYRAGTKKLIELFKKQKMVAFYLLDMSLEKFCTFFERSNSRAVPLNFTDILAAKLYRGFNLRAKIAEFRAQYGLDLPREVIVRALAYVRADGRESTSIDKHFILQKLVADDFTAHWDAVCDLYHRCLTFLLNQHYISRWNWMPSENMIVPLMMFLREIKSFDRMKEDQRRFLDFWYWSSVFANRYSSASNETIILDSRVLTAVASGQRFRLGEGTIGPDRNYFSQLRSRVKEPDDLYSYTKRTSVIYRGTLNLLAFAARGLRGWMSAVDIDREEIDDHHIFPRAYIDSGPKLDIDLDTARQRMDCVANRTLIPRITNIQIGRKSPARYLAELRKTNDRLEECLAHHLIPVTLLTEPSASVRFNEFLEKRAASIFALIEQFAIRPAMLIGERYGVHIDATEVPPPPRARLEHMIADGRVRIGDEVYTAQHPEQVATIVDAHSVEFRGKRVFINTWGQEVNGWRAINIYESVILKRTGQPLKQLREHMDNAAGAPAPAKAQPSKRGTNQPKNAAQPGNAADGASRRS